MYKAILLALVFVLVASVPAIGSISARSESMGKTGLSFIGDPSATYLNPAFLSDMESSAISGRDIIIIHYDDLGNRYGHLSQYSAVVNNNIGFLYYNGIAKEFFIISFGQSINQNLSLGGGVIINLASDFYTSSQIILAGLLKTKYFNFAAVTYYEFESGEFNLSPGITYNNHNGLIIALESNENQIRFGVEQTFNNFSIRWGVIEDSQTYGIGYKFNGWKIDLGKNASNNYEISLGVQF